LRVIIYYIGRVLEFIGGVTLLAGRVLKIIFSGKLDGALLLRQMVALVRTPSRSRCWCWIWRSGLRLRHGG